MAHKLKAGIPPTGNNASVPTPLSAGWWLWAALILGGALAGTLCIINNPHLWFDEAGQFFISLGLDHWAPTGAQPQGLGKMLHYNNHYLFDPFGYTLLFRGWQGVSTAAPWLRFLPFLGFCGLLFSGYRFLRLAGVRGPIALLLIALLPSSPLLYQHAGEIRPYIFEAWGAVFCSCVLLRFGRTPGMLYPLLAGLGMSAFLWIRYPFVIACGITGLLLLVQLLVTRPAGGAKRFALYVLPQVVSAIAIYLLCIRHQPITTQMPPYGMPTTIRYNPAFLLHPWTMLYHALILLFLAVALFAKQLFPQSKLRLGRWACFVLLLLAAWSFLSAIGKISSDPSSRWGIEINAIALLCAALLLALLLEKLPKPVLPAGLLLVGVVALYRPALQTYRWFKGDVVRFPGEVFAKELGQVSQSYLPEIWSPSVTTPEIKYLFEWGSLRPIKAQARYPEHFVFLNIENRMNTINTMPLNRPVLWVGNPGQYTIFGRHEGAAAGNSKGIFYWMWRIK